MRYLWLVSVIWGLSFGLIKVSFAGIDPTLLGALRLGLALLVFLPLLQAAMLTWTRFWPLCLIGLVQYGLMYALLFASFPHLAGLQVAILTITTPLLVVGLEHWWSRQGGVSLWIVACLALFGAGILLFNPYDGPLPWKGILLVQLSNTCFAWGQIAYRQWHPRWAEYADARVFAVPYAAGALLLAGLALSRGAWPQVFTLSGAQWGTLFYLGLIASGGCFFWWNYGARQVQVSQLAVMNNMKVPLAVLFSLLLFGESVSPVSLVWGGLLMAISWGWANHLAKASP